MNRGMNNFRTILYNLKMKFAAFMRGRYGYDQFNRFLSFLSIALLIVSMFFPAGGAGSVMFWLAFLILIYSYFRMFSRNYKKRYTENNMFLGYTKGIRSYINTLKLRYEYRKTHHIYRCPKCKANVRIPKGKGKISITCPKCRHEFVKVS